MRPQREETRYVIFDTAFGWCAVAWTANGLTRFIPAMRNAKAAERELLHSLGALDLEAGVARSGEGRRIVDAVRKYFAGEETDFSGFRADLRGATAFQLRVWQVVRKLSYGSTRTYKWVAEQMRTPKAVRAVGNAIGRNPLPVIIPCHRVIGSDGKPHGFSACGGVALKRKMLALENNHNRRRTGML